MIELREQQSMYERFFVVTFSKAFRNHQRLSLVDDNVTEICLLLVH